MKLLSIASQVLPTSVVSSTIMLGLRHSPYNQPRILGIFANGMVMKVEYPGRTRLSYNGLVNNSCN